MHKLHTNATPFPHTVSWGVGLRSDGMRRFSAEVASLLHFVIQFRYPYCSGCAFGPAEGLTKRGLSVGNQTNQTGVSYLFVWWVLFCLEGGGLFLGVLVFAESNHG